MDWQDVAKWLWGALVPAGWWIFNKQDKRMDALEAAMKEKADKEEMGRQRDNIAKIFDELKEVREDINQKHIATLEAIHSYFPGRR